MGPAGMLDSIGEQTYSVFWSDDIQVKVFTTKAEKDEWGKDPYEKEKIYYMILRRKMRGSEDTHRDTFWEVIYQNNKPSTNIFNAVQSGLIMCQVMFRHELNITS